MEPNDQSPPRSLKETRTWRPLVLRLHFYAGILVAPFILVAAITGGLYAVAPTLESVVYHDYLHVNPSGKQHAVAEQVAVAERQRPDLTVAAVRPAPGPTDTTRVLFDDPSLPDSTRLAVFVNPYTATPIGDLPVYGSAGALPLRTWLDHLHRDLHLGEAGRAYSEIAASWLWVVTLGGLYLWFRRYRRRRRSVAPARFATLDRRSAGRERTLNWHGVVGLWISVVLLFLSATGLTWSALAGQHVTDLRAALGWQTPTINTTIGTTPAQISGHEGHDGGHHPGGPTPAVDASAIDSVLSVAREHGVTGAVEVTVPDRPGVAYTVTQTRQPWMFSPDAIAIDGATGTVTDTLPFSAWPLPAQLTTLAIALHMGILFGLANQIALLGVVVGLVSVIARGYLLWWRRRPTRGTAWALGRPPLRGGLRRVGPVAAAAVGVAAVAIGWFVPWLGIPLAGFLAVDMIAAAWQRFRHAKQTLAADTPSRPN
ncbi:PepSY domain-containing protein [Skermania sp. ID1734]|nr:PepSY domain-containing protein [Skermania sp. ID1734]TSD94288.1 PepSY domain-containing protein [Skermania sp. ID1734]